MTLESVVARLAEQVERRYFGKYRAFVVDNEDPEQLGRLKLTVPSVLGEEVVTGWAMPCVPYGGEANQGFFFIPEVGAGVWVEFEEGDLEFPIWVGTFWSKPGGTSEVPTPNDETGADTGSIQDPPTRKIIKTVNGHTLQFEDADEEVRIVLADGEDENHIVFSKTGLSVVNKKNNNSIVMTDDGIVVTDANGNTLTQDASGTIIEDANGNTITQDAMGILIEDANGSSITMSATAGFPAGPGIDLNGGSRVCLEGLITWLLSHQHVGNMGAPTPLFPANMIDLNLAIAGTPGNGLLSETVKAK